MVLRPKDRSDLFAVGAYGCAGAVILKVRVAAGVRRCGRGDRRDHSKRESKSERDFGHHGVQPRYVRALDQKLRENPSVACNLDIDVRLVRCSLPLAADVLELLKWKLFAIPRRYHASRQQAYRSDCKKARVKPGISITSLTAFSRPRTPAWDWACALRAPSSKRMVDAFEPTMIRPVAALD